MYDSSDSFSPAQPDFVRQIRSHIKNLQTELDSRRTAFEASVAPLEAHIRQYQSMLCPCHSLPTEVWGEIFKFVPTLRKFTEEDSFVVNIHPNSSEYPWNISRVCRRWRMICITSPNIWNSVSLTKMDRFTSGTNSILSAVLERAITSPSLHIRLDFTSFSLEYLPTMQEYLPRITHLHVEGKAKEFARLTTILPLSNLRELTVRVFAAWFSFSDNDSDDIENEDEETGSQWDDEPLDCMPILRSFQSCPKLRVLGLEVDMDGMCAEAEPIDHAALTFPWSQLAELTISWPNNGGVLAPLYESCENLEKLSFDGYAYSPASPHHWEAVAQVVLPKLSSLDLQNVPWGMPQSFVCPSLDTLCIGSICYEPDVMDMGYRGEGEYGV
ncbi:hypothetical protein CYLTODRAFT_295356 [Cylindrobasidium torrendii FP15055 ss-10]|uniref:Uncharacterized protein n=1 Tax=Cylindrobasidium torrendii FP15055 ss-10 TaxID=1314674 RepID=A0A0D7BAW0_9AGAR|nr:hypothetical protein CYLTODRAFT_295356 [Cylindrobasidium torrendii FP15055 ss-10]